MNNQFDKNYQDKKPLSLTVNIIGIVIFLIGCTVITIVIWPYIGDFIKTPTAFPVFVDENQTASYFIYMALQILQVVVAVIPGEFLEIGAGLAFGWFFGFLIAETGVAVGTVIIFFLFRLLGKPLIQRFISDKHLQKLEWIDQHPKRDRIIFLIFLIPGLPKDLLTYAGSFFDISIQRFLFLTLIARIPSIVTSTLAGQSIINGNYKTAILIFLITGLLALIGFISSEKTITFIQKHRSP